MNDQSIQTPNKIKVSYIFSNLYLHALNYKEKVSAYKNADVESELPLIKTCNNFKLTV